MALACITFSSSDGKSYELTNDFGSVATGDIEDFLKQSREAAIVLEGELMKRQPGRASDQAGEFGKCCERLHKAARELHIRMRLDGKAAKHVNDAVEIMVSSHVNSQTRIYQEFLYDILCQCGTGAALLCAGSLGKKKVIDLGKNDRVNLLEHVKATIVSLSTPTLESLAREYDILPSNSQHLAHIQVGPRKRVQTTDDAETQMPHGNKRLRYEEVHNPSSPIAESTEKQACIENQPLDTRPKHFSEDALRVPYVYRYQDELAPPSAESREMKQICTNALASNVDKLPDPFKTAIQNSRLWKWERSQPNLQSTSCLVTLFPRDNKQDVSFTIWCGYDDGYHLNDVFGLKLAMST